MPERVFDIAKFRKICYVSNKERGAVMRELQKRADSILDNPEKEQAGKPDRIQDEFAYYIRQLKDYPILDEKEVVQLVERWQKHKDLKARDRLVYSNTRLVISIALQFTTRGMPLVDLVQEGTIGLIKAINKFDLQLGNKLSTYATFWIRTEISRASSGYKRPYYLQPKIEQMVTLIARAISSFFNQYGWLPDDKEVLDWIHTLRGTEDETQLAKAMNMEHVKLCRCILTERSFSLDTPLLSYYGTDRRVTYGDMMADEKPGPETIAEARQELEELSGTLKRVETEINALDPRERAIVHSRLQEGKTLQEIGDVFQISRERIRQIEEKTLKRIGKRLKITKKHLKQILTVDTISKNGCRSPILPLTADAPNLFKLLCEHLILTPAGLRIVKEPLRTLLIRKRLLPKEAAAVLEELRASDLIEGEAPWTTIRIIPEVATPAYNAPGKREYKKKAAKSPVKKTPAQTMTATSAIPQIRMPGAPKWGRGFGKRKRVNK